MNKVLELLNKLKQKVLNLVEEVKVLLGFKKQEPYDLGQEYGNSYNYTFVGVTDSGEEFPLSNELLAAAPLVPESSKKKSKNSKKSKKSTKKPSKKSKKK